MTAGLRWGELRAKGGNVDPALLVAPSGESRQNLKKLTMESKWADVVEAAQAAAGGECGRGWLDVHRYIARACEKIGACPSAAETGRRLGRPRSAKRLSQAVRHDPDG